MTEQELYSLSEQVNLLLRQSQALLRLHLTRYKHLVDSSTKRFDCSYARMTHRYFHEEIEQERNCLLELQRVINSLVKELEVGNKD